MRTFISTLAVFGWMCFVFDTSARGICIRADRDDSLYQALANSTFPFGGGFYDDNGTYGSGVLISPNWILTAKHAISGSQAYFISNAGWSNISASYTNANYDIAICKLSSPLTSIAPVKLYSVEKYGSEIGKECYISGWGLTGTGITGMDGGLPTSWWIRRAAQSYVMCNATDWGWGDALLDYFRSPDSGAKHLEGIGVEGDSGGGLYLNVGNEMALAGIQSYDWYSTTMGVYGTGSGYIRTGTADMLNWIRSYATDATIVGVPEPSSLVLAMMASLAIVGLRLRRKPCDQRHS